MSSSARRRVHPRFAVTVFVRCGLVGLAAVAVDGCTSSGEAARERSPDGFLDALVIETTARGATSHQVVIAPQGQPTSAGVAVASFAGALRSETSLGVNLVWVGNRALRIEYLRAARADLETKPFVRVAGREVSVGLVPGLTDHAAPPGPMRRRPAPASTSEVEPGKRRAN